MPAIRLLPVPLGLAAVVLLGGCGVTNPYQRHATSTANVSTGPAAATSRSAAASTDRQIGAVATVARYAQLATNWTSTTLNADQHQLAELSRGAARAQALQTAATYGQGSSLQHSKVTNSGQVTSIAPGRGPRRGEWVITTQERTGGTGDYAGLPAQPHIYYAHLTRTGNGWTIDTWSPQN